MGDEFTNPDESFSDEFTSFQGGEGAPKGAGHDHAGTQKRLTATTTEVFFPTDPAMAPTVGLSHIPFKTKVNVSRDDQPRFFNHTSVGGSQNGFHGVPQGFQRTPANNLPPQQPQFLSQGGFSFNPQWQPPQVRNYCPLIFWIPIVMALKLQPCRKCDFFLLLEQPLTMVEAQNLFQNYTGHMLTQMRQMQSQLKEELMNAVAEKLEAAAVRRPEPEQPIGIANSDEVSK